MDQNLHDALLMVKKAYGGETVLLRLLSKLMSLNSNLDYELEKSSQLSAQRREYLGHLTKWIHDNVPEEKLEGTSLFDTAKRLIDANSPIRW